MDTIMYIDAKSNISKTISVKKKVIRDSFPLHWHDFFEMDIVVGGTGYQILNGKKYPLKKGIAYILRPADCHEIHAGEPLEFLNIMFHESILSEEFVAMLLNQSGDVITLLNSESYLKISSISDMLLEEYNQELLFKEKYIKNLMDLILMVFMREFKPDSRNETYDIAIKKALLYMHMHFREKLSLEGVSANVGFCSSYFSKMFRQYTGMTYTNYLTRLRLEYAARVLEGGSVTSTDLCFESGFSSVSNFLKSFKKYYGVSPKEYEKQKI